MSYKKAFEVLYQTVEIAGSAQSATDTACNTADDVVNGEGFWQAVTSNMAEFFVNSIATTAGYAMTAAVTIYAPGPIAKGVVVVEGVAFTNAASDYLGEQANELVDWIFELGENTQPVNQDKYLKFEFNNNNLMIETPTETYEIQAGDTVWDIAQEYGMSVAEVLALNPWLTAEGRVSDDQSFILIKPGEKLQITPDWATYLKGKDEDLFMGSLTSNFADAEALTITRPPVDPLILDLDGDGIETTTIGDGIYFDHETDGFAEKTSWTGNNDVIMFDKYYTKIAA